MTTTAEAVRLLGMPENEVDRTYEHEHGPVVVTTDGVHTLVADIADGAGVTGPMLLHKPDPDRTYAVHVFEPLPDAEPADDELPADDNEGDDEGDDVGSLGLPERPPEAGHGSGVKAWRAYAVAMGVDPDEAATLDKATIVERFPLDDDEGDTDG